MFPSRPSIPFLPASDDTPIGTIMPDGMTYIGMLNNHKTRVLFLINMITMDDYDALHTRTDALLQQCAEQTGYDVIVSANGNRLQTSSMDPRHPGDLRLATDQELCAMYQANLFDVTDNENGKKLYEGAPLMVAMPGYSGARQIVDVSKERLVRSKKHVEQALLTYNANALSAVVLVTEPFYDMDTITDWRGYGGRLNAANKNPYKTLG